MLIRNLESIWTRRRCVRNAKHRESGKRPRRNNQKPNRLRANGAPPKSGHALGKSPRRSRSGNRLNRRLARTCLKSERPLHEVAAAPAPQYPQFAREGIDAFNERLLVALQRDGSSYLSNATLGGRFALRGCVLNYRTTLRDMEMLLDDLRRVAGEDVKKYEGVSDYLRQ